MLEALRCVDIVRPYFELEYVSACKALDVDVFVVGEDWGSKPHNIDVEFYLKNNDKRVVQVLYNARTSSTAIKGDVLAQQPKLPIISPSNDSAVAHQWPAAVSSN